MAIFSAQPRSGTSYPAPIPPPYKTNPSPPGRPIVGPTKSLPNVPNLRNPYNRPPRDPWQPKHPIAPPSSYFSGPDPYIYTVRNVTNVYVQEPKPTTGNTIYITPADWWRAFISHFPRNNIQTIGRPVPPIVTNVPSVTTSGVPTTGYDPGTGLPIAVNPTPGLPNPVANPTSNPSTSATSNYMPLILIVGAIVALKFLRR